MKRRTLLTIVAVITSTILGYSQNNSSVNNNVSENGTVSNLKIELNQPSVLEKYLPQPEPTIPHVNSETTENNIPVEIFPNPNNGIFNLKFSDIKEDIYIDVYNCLGATVLNYKYNSSIPELNISDQFPGIYFIKITIGTNSSVKKIIKQ